MTQFSWGQEISVKIVDKSTREGIPYVKIYQKETSFEHVSGPKGYFTIKQPGEYAVDHPMYNSQHIMLEQKEDTVIIELGETENIRLNERQYILGKEAIEKFHQRLPANSTTKFPQFEFLSTKKIEVYEQSNINPGERKFLTSFESLEKNRFKFPNKKYARVVRSYYNDGDSSRIGFIPINTYSLEPSNEYLNTLNIKFYNPFFREAHKRYDFAIVDSLTVRGKNIYVIYFSPKPKKRFVGLKGTLYLTKDRTELWGGYLMPNEQFRQDFTLTFYTATTSKNTRFLQDLNVVLRLKNIPNYGRNSVVYYDTKNTSPVFDITNNSNAKWVNMALFNYEKDTLGDDTWMMTQIVDKEKLEYIKKDTADRKFWLSNTLKWMYNTYEGKLGYRARFFDLNNEFAINKFEAVRIGIGLQSHENLSDIFTFGGYFAYGIKDAKFKYGGNVGIYLGKTRSNLLSFRFTRDLLEPGLINYMDMQQDLVRDFFTSRMDEYYSSQVSLNSRINAFLTSSILFNNYSLKPLYEYIYNPNDQEITEAQTFNFTETSFLLNIGTPFSINPNLRNVLYRNKRFRSNLLVNLTKGWRLENGGDYEYWKLNGRLSSNVRIKGKGILDVVLDGGLMSKNQPYQINYVGPGTEFKLTGIIINNAFQSMKLYGFFADRYIHSFSNYNLGNIFTKGSKFSPELSFALNFGWGKITSQKEIHENIDVRDYSNGYFEAGVLLNNLLRLRFYNYFYGGLGIGTFYGFGPDAEHGAWAIRISYELGVL